MHDFSVVDSRQPENLQLLANVKGVRTTLSKNGTGTTFLLGQDGLTVIRRPAVELRNRMESAYANLYGAPEIHFIDKTPEPQVLRLRLAQETRQSTLGTTVSFDSNFGLWKPGAVGRFKGVASLRAFLGPRPVSSHL